jgi:hypothetical protein
VGGWGVCVKDSMFIYHHRKHDSVFCTHYVKVCSLLHNLLNQFPSVLVFIELQSSENRT